MFDQTKLVVKAFHHAATWDIQANDIVVGLFWLPNPGDDTKSVTYRLVASAGFIRARVDQLHMDTPQTPWHEVAGQEGERIWRRLLEVLGEGGGRKNVQPDYDALQSLDAQLALRQKAAKS